MKYELDEKRVYLSPSEGTFYRDLLKSRKFNLGDVSCMVFPKLSGKYQRDKLVQVLNGRITINESELKRLDNITHCMLVDIEYYTYLVKCHEAIQMIKGCSDQADKFPLNFEF